MNFNEVIAHFEYKWSVQVIGDEDIVSRYGARVEVYRDGAYVMGARILKYRYEYDGMLPYYERKFVQEFKKLVGCIDKVVWKLSSIK